MFGPKNTEEYCSTDSDARCDSSILSLSALRLRSRLTNDAVVQSLEEWAGPRVQSYPLTSLRKAVIGVDASHYLDLRLNGPASHEPLLNAIGGDPYTLKAALQDDLSAFQAVDATLIFVFDGLDYKNKEQRDPSGFKSTLKAHKDGWKEYYNGENGKELAAERTLKAFAKASTPDKSTF